ncbi:MAG: hypothetical protein UV46_C0077G0008 [Candidatus Gottesmanbacteria bacterium GW2011_GWC2_42_8]|nr:MAG: hypothetical protein UV46_C0077G0008 [Candidatus Gottesmanbacteria bacterium GW2011_GWC2_42_8]
MNEKINEKISVVTVFDREKRTVMHGRAAST